MEISYLIIISNLNYLSIISFSHLSAYEKKFLKKPLKQATRCLNCQFLFSLTKIQLTYACVVSNYKFYSPHRITKLLSQFGISWEFYFC